MNEEKDQPKKLYTKAEAARILGISPKSVDTFIRNYGLRVRIHQDDLERFVEKSGLYDAAEQESLKTTGKIQKSKWRYEFVA